eukprot:13649861-Alexandrium_andersonii.AAC.1
MGSEPKFETPHVQCLCLRGASKARACAQESAAVADSSPWKEARGPVARLRPRPCPTSGGR